MSVFIIARLSQFRSNGSADPNIRGVFRGVHLPSGHQFQILVVEVLLYVFHHSLQLHLVEFDSLDAVHLTHVIRILHFRQRHQFRFVVQQVHLLPVGVVLSLLHRVPIPQLHFRLVQRRVIPTVQHRVTPTDSVDAGVRILGTPLSPLEQRLDLRPNSRVGGDGYQGYEYNHGDRYPDARPKAAILRHGSFCCVRGSFVCEVLFYADCERGVV